MGDRKTEQDTQWPPWLEPFALELATQYFGNVMPGLEITPEYNKKRRLDYVNITGDHTIGQLPDEALIQVAGFDPAQEQAINSIIQQSQSGQSQALANSAAQELQRTIGGEYLSPDSNPYLRGSYDAAARALTDNYQLATAPALQSAAARTGAFGGSAENELGAYQRYGLGENLGNLANQMYGQAYEGERGRQLYAQQLLPSAIQAQYTPAQLALGAGGLRQQQSQAQMDAATQNALRQQEYPFQLLSQLSGGLGAALGPAGEGQTIRPERLGYIK